MTSAGRTVECTVNYVDTPSETPRLNFILTRDGRGSDRADAHALESEFGVLHDPRLTS